jgi:tryptophan synthase alpha chain
LVKRVRNFSSLPIAVGFGISNRDQVLDVQRYADAVVVGSAIVQELERVAGEPDIPKRIGEFARSLVTAKSTTA